MKKHAQTVVGACTLLLCAALVHRYAGLERTILLQMQG
jgi:hypothetical protein